MVRDDGLLEFAREDKGVQVLEISLLHTCFGKHLKEISKEMVYCTDTDTKLRCDSKGPL